MRKKKNFLQKLLSKDFKDSDADGLSDSYERKIGTNPYKKDSDDDDLNDLEEVFVYGTDPNDPDTDKDGTSDGEEVSGGSNPKGPGKLKDLFISHEGNDYHPHIFHPKRLTLYTLSAVLIKVLVVALAIFLPTRAWLTPDILTQESKRVIELTNQFRQEKGIDTLETSDKLTQAAFKKCQDMLIKQYFSHVSPNNNSVSTWLSQVNYSYGTAGENLAMGFSKAPELVQAWKDSPSHRKNLLDSDYSEIGVAMSSGEYQEENTTLVAQYFARPFTQTQPENTAQAETKETEQEEQEESPQPEVQDTPEKEEKIEDTQDKEESSDTPEQKKQVESKTTTNDSNSEPLPEEQNQPETKSNTPTPDESTSEPEVKLKKPNLEIWSEMPTSQTEVEISFSAPEAERVEIYSQGEVVKEMEGSFEESQTTSLSLEEGRHELYVKSLYQDQVESSKHKLINIDTTPPRIDQENTYVEVNEVQDESQLVIQANAQLSPDTTQARLSFKDTYNLNLTKQKNNTWRGSTIVNADKEELFSPMIPANLQAQDKAGNSLSQTIDWKNVKPINTSSWDQYFYLKSNPSPLLSSIFSVGSVYYIALLSLALIILGVNIILDIKKQRKHVILSVLGFSVILSFLIWF